MCRHGNGPAERCSQCLGIPARRVDQVGEEITVDGVATRSIAGKVQSARDFYRSRRGGKSNG